MKAPPLSFCLLLAALPSLVTCGSPTLTCQTANCSSGGKTYQACTDTGGSISYNFGGQSCSCSSSTSTMCQTCGQQVASYCIGVPVGGSGGAGGTGGVGGTGATDGGTGATGGGTGGLGAMDGGGGGTGGISPSMDGGADSAHVTCTATFSGGITGTYSPCAMTVTYIPAAATWTVGTAGNAIPSTPYTWAGFNMAISGTAAVGTYDQQMSLGTSAEITQLGGANPPIWEAGYGKSNTFGSASLTLTSLGPSTAVAGSTLYQSPHGTVTATLVDQNPVTHLPDVMMTVTF